MAQLGGTGRIDARVLGGVSPIIREGGVDLAEVTRRSGVAPSSPDDTAIPLPDFVRFMETAGALGGDGAFIWRCGRRYAPTGVSDLLAGNPKGMLLGTLLTRLVSAVNRVQSDSILRLGIADGLAVLEYRLLDPSVWPRARDVEFTLGFFDGVLRASLGKAFAPELVAFEHETDMSSAAIARCVGIPILHGRPINSYAFPSRCLETRLETDCGLGATAAGEGIGIGQGEADLASRLRAAILASIGEGKLSQAAIAELCGLTERTLRRRLLGQGIRFRDEIDGLRMHYARAMLANTHIPLIELALRLGYTQQPDFSRAFRRVHGLTPQAFRQHAASG